MMDIRIDNLSSPEIIGLLEEHLEDMVAVTPQGSVHALDLEALKKPEITFWSVWEQLSLVGCGAVKELDPRHGQIKSMRTAANRRGHGVASHLLEFILGEARQRGYTRLSLETGGSGAFAPARHLYTKYGFTPCGPFADYGNDPHSVYMTIILSD